MAYSNLSDLVAAVESNEGVLTVPMRAIRDACSFQRLRTNVVRTISRRLQDKGLNHWPRKLPEDQSRSVRVYMIGSPAGEIIETVLSPGKKYDAKIRELAAGDGALLDRVRKLVNGEAD